MPKVWLITGTSSGLGESIAKEVLDKGDILIATARNSAKISPEIRHHQNSLVTDIDVTDIQSVNKAIKETVQIYGKLDVLVNNAGIGYMGAVEETDPQAARQVMETDFWGVSNMINAALPTMRKQKSGLIINVTSEGGLVSFPATGYYHAAKFAVEGLTGSLAQEVEPLGIRIMNVEPGAFKTKWNNSSKRRNRVIHDYDSTAGKMVDHYDQAQGKQKGDPDLAAQLIYEAANESQPPKHLVVGAGVAKTVKDYFSSIEKDVDNWKDRAEKTSFGDQ